MQPQTSTHMLPIAVPGARGAYSQTAARRFFGTQSPVLSCKDSGSAVRAITEGRASHAVIPVENSITGTFHGVADAFFQGDVAILGEVLLLIRHSLLAAPGTRLEDLSVVSSHATTLSQCRDWIASWGLAATPVADTAEAAEDLAASGDGALGVIGNREMAASYGLEILAEGLSDRPDNRTRFLILGDMQEQEDQGIRFAVKVGPVRTPRLLKTLRIQLESMGASRVRVPFLGSEDGRRFLVEFDHRKGNGPKALKSACGSLPHCFLGAWSPAETKRRAG